MGIIPEYVEYRLPTEAEWEYACRAGTSTAFAFGDELSSDMANFRRHENDDREETIEVGVFPANGFGIFDMHGNVSEWCGDWFAEDYYVSSPHLHPLGPSSGRYRVVRGGSWDSADFWCRSMFRSVDSPDDRINYIGFRPVRIVKR